MGSEQAAGVEGFIRGGPGDFKKPGKRHATLVDSIQLLCAQDSTGCVKLAAVHTSASTHRLGGPGGWVTLLTSASLGSSPKPPVAPTEVIKLLLNKVDCQSIIHLYATIEIKHSLPLSGIVSPCSPSRTLVL